MEGAEDYLHTKWHLHLSKRLATVHQRHRQTGQNRQQLSAYDVGVCLLLPNVWMDQHTTCYGGM